MGVGSWGGGEGWGLGSGGSGGKLGFGIGVGVGSGSGGVGKGLRGGSWAGGRSRRSVDGRAMVVSRRMCGNYRGCNSKQQEGRLSNPAASFGYRVMLV